MTSIKTNVASMAALQTLRTVSAGLRRTQIEVSSGLKIKAAADGAAYWSIATTMRSDRKAISAVGDALGVAAAKVDVAYTALTSAVNIVSDIRAKLVAATEKSIDKEKIQDELDQLKDQLVSAAKSASFNGINWLETTEQKDLWEVTSLPASIPSSFIRSSNGSVSIGQTLVDLSDISLFNAGGGGALQKDTRSLGSIGGLRGSELSQSGRPGSATFNFTGAMSFAANSQIQFGLTVDGSSLSSGQSFNATLDKATVNAAVGRSDGVVRNAAEFAAALGLALGAAGAPVIVTGSSAGNRFTIASREATGEPGSSIAVANVVSSLPTNTAGGLQSAPIASIQNDYAKTGFGFSGPFRVYRDVAFSFDVESGNGVVHSAVVSRQMVDSALGTADGRIDTAADMAKVLDSALVGSGIAASTEGDDVLFSVDSGQYPVAGTRSSIQLRNVHDTIGAAPDFDITQIDITKPDADLNNYLFGVENMLGKTITAAARLGALQRRVDLQSSLAQNLGDSIDKGISRLVDADMEEASARLAAQQTQQQLATQALQLSNSSTQTILQLFRS